MGVCYNLGPAAVQSASYFMELDRKDLVLRTLILVAGGLSALLLAMEGHGVALPAVAVGGALGAFVAARVQATEE